MDVGFIGLGVMGLPMAANLRAAGHRVTAFARNPEAAAAARDRGIEVRESISEASRAPLVITMLTDGAAVSEVALGTGGVLASVEQGTVYVDMSTIAPGEWAEVAAGFTARGIDVIDAPVSGGEQGAIDGALSIMAGGNAVVIESVTDVLSTMGTVVRVGETGAGQIVKAANQLIVAGNLQLVAEALVLAQKGGVDPEIALDVIGRGLGGSTVIQRKRDAMLAREYAPGFRLALHAKDLGIVADTARSARLALPLTAAVTQIVNTSVATGRGDLDHAALYELAREANGMDA